MQSGLFGPALNVQREICSSSGTKGGLKTNSTAITASRAVLPCTIELSPKPHVPVPFGSENRFFTQLMTPFFVCVLRTRKSVSLELHADPSSFRSDLASGRRGSERRGDPQSVLPGTRGREPGGVCQKSARKRSVIG